MCAWQSEARGQTRMTMFVRPMTLYAVGTEAVTSRSKHDATKDQDLDSMRSTEFSIGYF